MGTAPYFSSVHHRDIHGYYQALRSFFEINEAKHDRSNSPRAQKARAKLLKLSSSQFYELSTDVYDELQRRMNYDTAQPEYLLPKASFHIKRNQARQKLANLSQTRFNDLVDDILFEIKRRGYDAEPISDESQTDVGKINLDIGSSASADTSGTLIPSTTALQTSQVIPKKASIDWSSDEEDANNATKDNTENTRVSDQANDASVTKVLNINTGVNSIYDHQDKRSSIPSDTHQIATPITKTVADNYQFMDFNNTPLSKEAERRTPEPSQDKYQTDANENLRSINPIHDTHEGIFTTPTMIKTQSSNVPATNKSPETEVTTSSNVIKGDEEVKDGMERAEECNNKQVIEQEECTEDDNGKGTNENDKEDGKRDLLPYTQISYSTDRNIKNAPNTPHQKELTSLSAQVSALSIENEKLKQQLSELEFRSRQMNSSKGGYNKSVKNLDVLDKIQEKYPLDEKSISRFISEDASVPFDLVTKINGLIISFYLIVQTEKEDIGRDLFETLSKLSDSISELLVFVDTPDYRDEVILLKASLSHMITATRYYSAFSALLPKITIQAAVSELAFSICNVIGVSKVLAHDHNLGRKSDMGTLVKIPEISKPSPHNADAKNLQILEVPSFSSDPIDEMSPVKPLKITQRANMSPTPTANSSRRPSGNLLFSMIDRKSPLSSAHSSKVNFKFATIPSRESKADIKAESDTGSGDNGKEAIGEALHDGKAVVNFKNEEIPLTPQRDYGDAVNELQMDDENSDHATPLRFEKGIDLSDQQIEIEKKRGDSGTKTPVSINTKNVHYNTDTSTEVQNKGLVSELSDIPGKEFNKTKSDSPKFDQHKPPENTTNATKVQGVVENGNIRGSLSSKDAPIKSLPTDSTDKSISTETPSSLSSNRTFADKLNSFTNGTGIGLRVDNTSKDTTVPVDSLNKPTDIKDDSNVNKDNVKAGPTKGLPFISITKDTSPSKLTNRLRETFEHMSEEKSDTEGDHDMNSDSSADDMETYIQLQKSLKKSEPNSEPRPELKSEPKSEPKSELISKLISESEFELKPEPKSEPKSELISKLISESEFELKPESKSEPKFESKPESKSETKIFEATDLSAKVQQYEDGPNKHKVNMKVEENSSSLDLNRETLHENNGFINTLPLGKVNSPTIKVEEDDDVLGNMEKEHLDSVTGNGYSKPSNIIANNRNDNQLDYSDDYSDYQFVPLKGEKTEDTKEDRNTIKSSESKQNAQKKIGHSSRTPETKEIEENGEIDFNFDTFDIENPDNTLSELLLYLEHQTVEVISTIQSLLSSIKEPRATKGELRDESNAINQVINQMVGATSVSMNQSRNASLKEHGNWVVKSLEDCSLRMLTLCQLSHNGNMRSVKGDDDYADKNFKQRLAGIAFDVAKCTKELVKTVEEASLKEEIAYLNSHLN